MGRRSWILLGLVALAVAWPARADIYRCTDRDGTVHFDTSRHKGMRCEVAIRGRKKSGGAEAKAGAQRARKEAAQRHRDAARASRGSRPGSGAPGAERRRLYYGYLSQAARLYQLPDAFLRAVVKVESAFNPQVVSHAGAMGLMQLMPKTAAAMGVRNPFDPRQNIFGGARYLRILANKFNGDLVLTIAAYNAGEGAVMRYRGVPPYRETQRYVRRVLRHYYAFRQGGL